jgi:hypothetical protein
MPGVRVAVLLAAVAGLSAAQAVRATVVTLFQQNFSGGTSNMGIPVVATPVTNSSGTTITGSGSYGYVGSFTATANSTGFGAAVYSSSAIAIPAGVSELSLSFASALQDAPTGTGSYAYLKYALYINNSAGTRIADLQGNGPSLSSPSTSFQAFSTIISLPTGSATISPAQWELIYQRGTPSSAVTAYGSDFRVTYATVPEPATLGLMALGGLGILLVGKRRKLA